MKIFEYKVDVSKRIPTLDASTIYLAAENHIEAERAVSHILPDELIYLRDTGLTKIPTDKTFHANVTEKVLYRDLMPNDLVFEQGHLFKLNAIWSYLATGPGLKPTRDIIRCDDDYVKDYPTNKKIPGWAMHGVVGAGGKEQACIVKRIINPYM